jgi:hypothetical protein
MDILGTIGSDEDHRWAHQRCDVIEFEDETEGAPQTPPSARAELGLEHEGAPPTGLTDPFARDEQWPAVQSGAGTEREVVSLERQHAPLQAGAQDGDSERTDLV